MGNVHLSSYSWCTARAPIHMANKDIQTGRVNNPQPPVPWNGNQQCCRAEADRSDPADHSHPYHETPLFTSSQISNRHPCPKQATRHTDNAANNSPNQSPHHCLPLIGVNHHSHRMTNRVVGLFTLYHTQIISQEDRRRALIQTPASGTWRMCSCF